MTSLITPEELLELQLEAEELFMTDVAILWRPVNVSDGAGGMTQTWQELKRVPCRAAPASHRPPVEERSAAADAILSYSFWILRVPAREATNIEPNMRIELVGRPGQFEIVTEFAPRTIGTVTRMVCMETR